MGKEWLWCAAGGGSGGGRREPGSPSGCLSVVFQLFDFHREVPSNFSSTTTIFQPEDQKPPILKGELLKNTPYKKIKNSNSPELEGIEAPRNSLEMDEPFRQAPLSSAIKMDDNLHIPMGIQIKTRVETVRSSTSEYTSSPDYLSSPGASKTPTLVARLMGLNLLPDTSSPSPCSSNRSSKNPKPNSKSHLKNPTGVRSLPETPRISSARKSDVDRRLSLQSSRDSVEQIELSGPSRIRFVKREIREDDEVRERVREIKEGVSRRFGVEITNRVKNRGIENRENENIRFENRGNEGEIVLLKATKTSKIGEGFGHSKYSMKLLEKEKQNQLILKKELEGKETLKKNNVIKNKQTEPFVRSNLGNIKNMDLVSEKRKFYQKMPLSKEIVKINGVSSSVLPVKKEPSFPLTKLPLKQNQSQVSNSLLPKSKTQLFSSSSHKYKPTPSDKSTVQCTNPDRSNGRGSTTFAGPQFLQYIKEILILSGIGINTSLMFTELHFGPSVFNYLELSHSHFTHHCNRKLIYELVCQLSEEILKPIMKFKTWGLPTSNDCKFCCSELIEMLCKKIGSFPESNCQVLEDIDALIDLDLGEIELRRLVALEEEGVKIVEEIGIEILDKIVNEMAREMI